MSKSKRNFIIVAVVLAVAYFVILGLGLVVGEGNRSKPPAWTETIDSLMSFMAPRLNLNGLRCEGVKIDQRFKLNKRRSSCSVDLSPGMIGDEDYWKVSLRLYTPKPQVFLKVFYDKRVAAPKPKSRPNDCDISKPTSGLELVYEMKEGDKENDTCWISADTKKPIPFTITGAAIITLKCLSCLDDDQKEVSLKFE